MLPLFNPLLLVFVIVTAFGVVMQGTKVDRAASIAIVSPIAGTTDIAIADASKSSEHVSVERISIKNQESATQRENVPKMQPRNDHTKYLQVKKFATSGGNGLWPSD
ncbi:MAG: hypothetical protein EOT05_01390 [Candidatus Microsaccharimonas sossegonensis]|uniref:Uncharacterized protein n=1 Tax=Candidatus Microsaccharimonas sossegonensis TaxID=2506948 RepID=A0A4Q0AHC2_9BACT|nr:MAG: hypothetical protein EOT05_01390 [Candidatus Microsaccharimonas sossegonensis]